MERQASAPAGVDTTIPNVARMYDYYLGGKNNFAADREAGDKVVAMLPEVPRLLRENRAFMHRAVRFLAGEAGVRQFLDIGAGLPTQENVHEVAHRVAPDARVVYVDYDPVVCAHGRALLHGVPGATVAQADLREPERLLAHPELRSHLDLNQPVAVLFVAVLHFVTDEEDPAGILARFREALAPGSHLVISHAPLEGHRETAAKIGKVYENATAPIIARTREQVLRFFDGFALVAPGLVDLADWRPDPDAAPGTESAPKLGVHAGVGRKT